MKTITELRQEIVDRSLQAFHEGLFSGTSGNMSCYLREEDLMLITPTSVRYDVMRAEDIVALRLDGTVVEGHLKPSSEWRMHTAVYEICPDVNAVFHTHSPYATAFAVNHQTIRGAGVPRRRHPLRGLRDARHKGGRAERGPGA